MHNHRTSAFLQNPRLFSSLILLGLCNSTALLTHAAEATSSHLEEYPTEERVDYVLGCMAANGQDYLTMQKCSCSIDTIADLIPYVDYEAVKTVLSMQDQRGEIGVLFRTERSMKDRVQAFRSAQVEADLRCF
ncbi:hypothetical protein ACPF7Z_10270 [Halomonas sp. GXIMD04776]|uniref:hypothetical protein n=1 Tax=Halomonas sp. GXIMD04776 TaxID=3415605 RepID=UPI003CC1669C